MGDNMRTLHVRIITKKELSGRWGMPLPKAMDDIVYIQCNSAGEVNWDKASVYTHKELAQREPQIHSVDDPVAGLVEHPKDHNTYGRKRRVLLASQYSPDQPKFWLNGTMPKGVKVTPLYPGEPITKVPQDKPNHSKTTS